MMCVFHLFIIFRIFSRINHIHSLLLLPLLFLFTFELFLKLLNVPWLSLICVHSSLVMVSMFPSTFTATLMFSISTAFFFISRR